MSKPKNYNTEKADGFTRICLSSHEKDGENYLKRQCFLSVNFTYELTKRSARAMGQRLLEIADWLEE